MLCPPLLNILDDTDTVIRSRAFKISQELIPKLGKALLLRSGLSAVFQSALFPNLAVLPSLASEKESVMILVPAYQTLFCLAGVLQEDFIYQSDSESVNLLQRILRDGVFMGIDHVGRNPTIIRILMYQSALAVRALGLETSKYLQVCSYCQVFI